jgi:hypothetical protein
MRTIPMFLASVMLLGGLCSAQTDVPLGDVARKKSTVKAKRVVTDEDMPSRLVVPTTAETEKTIAQPPEAAATASAIPTSNPDGTQLSSEQKLEAMQFRVDQLKGYEVGLAKHLKELAEKIENEPSDFRRNMYSEALQRQTGTLQAFKKERAELESGIEQQKQGTSSSEKNRTDPSDTPAN